MNEIRVFPGKPLPHGASLIKDGVNFSVFSRNAEKIWIDIFENPGDAQPVHSFALDADQHRTGDVWHIFLKGLGAGALYLYRVDGPFEPHNGHRFNKHTYLLDPYAKEITDFSIFKNLSPDYTAPVDSVDILLGKQYSAENFPKCVVIDDDEFDWQGDMSLNHPLRLSVIYETHLKGFTANPNSAALHPGTYRGMVEKIPYLKELGVTSVELLPIHEFDEYENTKIGRAHV